MKITDLLETETKPDIIDNKNGAGAVPFNRDIDYFGLRVFMKPVIFSMLALTLSRAEATSVDGLRQYLEQGGKIGAPFLMIDIPPEWKQGDFSTPASVRSHEGRNRMLAVRELYGPSVVVEVHLFPQGGLRARDIKPEWITHLNAGMRAERTDNFVPGPLFTV